MLAPFLVRMTFVTMIAPHKGSFNVTDKGGLLDRERFDWRASYPGVIMAVVLAVGLVSGIWAAIVHYHETLVFRAMAVNSIWVLFSLIIVLGGVAAARETRQRRHSHRVAASLPFELVDAQGQVHACRSVDVSMGAASLTPPRYRARRGRVMLRWSLPSGPATMGATIIARCGGRLHLQWVIAGLASERQVVALVFGRDDAWARWSDFPPDRPLRSLYLLVASICALFRPLRACGTKRRPPLRGKRQRRTKRCPASSLSSRPTAPWCCAISARRWSLPPCSCCRAWTRARRRPPPWRMPARRWWPTGPLTRLTMPI
ncbi:hypothetical protein RAA17_18585 [Komagataeibacter rhaeticus]|nr:hypothetical protein [Komagataeibacter rhaeticus]